MKKETTVELQDKIAFIKEEVRKIYNKCKEEVRDMTEDEVKFVDDSFMKISTCKNKIEEIRKELEKTVAKEDVKPATRCNNQINLINKSNMKFSLIKAINSIANGRALDDNSIAVDEVGKSEMRKAGISAQGQLQLPLNQRSVQVTGSDTGVVEVSSIPLIEPLRARNILVQAGARFLTGLVGDVQVPALGAGQVYWSDEVADAKDAGSSVKKVAKLSPKRLTAYLDISKQFLVQDSVSAEQMLQADLVSAINTKLESTILGKDAGTSNSPAGLFAPATTLTSFSGGVSSFANLASLEASLDGYNSLGNYVYVLSPKAKAILRQMPKSSKATQLVLEGSEIDGTPFYTTANMLDTNIIYGDISNICIGQWGGLDITIDPYTKASEGKIRIVVNTFFDAQLIRTEGIVSASVSAGK